MSGSTTSKAGASDDLWQVVDVEEISKAGDFEIDQVEAKGDAEVKALLVKADLLEDTDMVFQKEMLQILKEIKTTLVAARLENRKFSDVSKVNQKTEIQILKGLYDRCAKTATKVGFMEKRMMEDLLNHREFQRLVRQATDMKEEGLAYLEEREAPWPRLLKDCISNVSC